MLKLYEYGPSRSVRVRWTLLETGTDFESVAARDMIGTDAYRKIHPQAKLPAVVVDGKPLFESAAIATFVADQAPDAGLIAPSGTWERALHDQWVSFALTEMEAYLWSSFRNASLLPEEQRVPQILAQNARFARSAARVLDDALADNEYLVADRFSVTDIIVGFTVNWGRMAGLIDGFANLDAYLARLHAREHCVLAKAA